MNPARCPKTKSCIDYNDLSLLYQDQGRFTEAEALMKQSDGAAGQTPCHQQSARLYFVWGKVDEMKPCLDKAEKQAKKGKKTLALTFWQFNKGNYATLKGQYKEAEAAYKEGLESCNTLYGNTHLYYTIITVGSGRSVSPGKPLPTKPNKR